MLRPWPRQPVSSDARRSAAPSMTAASTRWPANQGPSWWSAMPVSASRRCWRPPATTPRDSWQVHVSQLRRARERHAAVRSGHRGARRGQDARQRSMCRYWRHSVSVRPRVTLRSAIAMRSSMASAHTRATPSSPPTANFLPSGLNATVSRTLRPVSARCSSPDSGSHRRTAPSDPAVATKCAVGSESGHTHAPGGSIPDRN